MYKKLFNFKRRSTDEISTKDLINDQQISVQPQIKSDCNYCCCNSSTNYCRDVNCPQAFCQLCTSSLILPSCVGAIRALQSSFAQHSESTPPKHNHKCCTSSRQWMSATDSLTTINKLHVIANTRCSSCSC